MLLFCRFFGGSMHEIDVLDRLGDVCALLDKMLVKFEVHRHDDSEFSYLKDSEVCVKIPNPRVERAIYIDFQDEISLFFGKEWHEHYSPDEYDYNEFRDTLSGFLKNELCSAAVFIGDERRWGGSMTSSKKEVAEYSAEEIMAFHEDVEEYRKSLEKKGAEIRFLFWDPSYDKIAVFEKR